MGKEERQAKRAARKEQRQDRREKLESMIDALKNGPKLPEDTQLPLIQENFSKYWPVARAVIVFAEASRLTGTKVDKTLNEIVDFGDSIQSEQDLSEFRKKIEGIWKVVRSILNAITVFTNDKVDEVIFDAIEIIDWIAGYDEND